MTGQLVREAIDESRVGAWLAAHVAGARPPFAYELIVGGHSNLTFQVTDAGGRRYVLRRPPLGPLLATAHNVVREHRLMAALGGTPVPVPPALAVCEDESVNGAPFFITGFVDGPVLDNATKASSLDAGEKRELAIHLIDVLAELHAIDLSAVGLEDLSRHDGYLERQIRRWAKQWQGSKLRELPAIDEVERLLRRGMPEQHGASLVHGDYRFGNCISDLARREIAAVLDWELCTIGDALADLGHLAVYWHDASRPMPVVNDPTSAGFPPYRDLLHRYATRTGRDVSHIEYYRAFAAWRLAIIAEGVASRERRRLPAEGVADYDRQSAVTALAQSALDSLHGLGRR